MAVRHSIAQLNAINVLSEGVLGVSGWRGEVVTNFTISKFVLHTMLIYFGKVKSIIQGDS